MNISYTGKQGELPPAQQRKLDERFSKLAKLVERRRGADRGAHVVITTERHLTKAEITVNFYDHSLVGIGSGPDYLTAMTGALERAEKQALKILEKRRDTTRSPKDKSAAVEVPAVPVAQNGTGSKKKAKPAPVVDEDAGPRIFRVNHHDRRKPMTLDEAMIEIDGRDYLVYRDSEQDCVSVLIRRKDGNFDLVES